MVRWRLCLLLFAMLMLPLKVSSKSEETDDDEVEGTETKSPIMSKQSTNSSNDENDEEDDEDDEDDDEDSEKPPVSAPEKESNLALTGRRGLAAVTIRTFMPARTFKKRPLECYVCAYKAETPLRACLDPAKYRVHSITCHSPEDLCFTSAMIRGDNFDAVVRGCRSACTPSPETTCCDINRCNGQAFQLPEREIAPLILKSKINTETNGVKCRLPNVLFFVTILLVLQTVVKVAFV